MSRSNRAGARLRAGRGCVCAALALTLALLPACSGGEGDGKGEGEASGDDVRAVEELRIAIEADTTEVAKEEEELDKKRAEIETELAELDAAREKLLTSGGGTAEADFIDILRREKTLREKELAYLKSRDSLAGRKDEILGKATGVLASASVKGGGGGGSSDVAAREKKTADREADIGKREKKIAEREAALALREAKGCPTAAPFVTRIEVPAGKTYTRKHADAAYDKAKAKMNKKGILLSDLPSGADSLPDQIEEAISAKDYATATVAAENLGALANGIRIDRAFVQAKIARLNAFLKKKKITPEKDKEVWTLFTTATREFSDGKFTKANVRINSIYATVK